MCNSGLRSRRPRPPAQAAAAAERERATLYNELDDRWLSSMGWEDYGSESFSRPPPELFGFNQVREHPSHASVCHSAVMA